MAAEGVPIRAIAERVFGDRRYRGRVERILGPPNSGAKVAQSEPVSTTSTPAGLEEAAPVEATATIRSAFDREINRIAAGLVEPSPAELRTLLDLQRRLEAREAVERLNALTRNETGRRQQLGP